MSNPKFKVLGLCNGSKEGNSELLLKAALQAIQNSSTVPIQSSWIHIPSVMIPCNPAPLPASADISLGNVVSMKAGSCSQNNTADDRRAVLDAILNADALIFATPVYSHQPPGFLKAVTDRILGPYTDAAFVQRVLERQKAGDPKYKDQSVDERVLKSRVVGFLAVAGSTHLEHHTMALATLHQFVYPIHAKVVDQVVFAGFASAGSVVFMDAGQSIERARLLGKNVASQLGKDFDSAIYFGPKPEGACPYCHLAKVDFFGGSANEIGCIVCGAKGNLVVENGKIMPVWNSDSSWSCITMEGKQLHAEHIRDAGATEARAFHSFPASKAETLKRDLLNLEIEHIQLSSHRSNQENTGKFREYRSWLRLEDFWSMTRLLRSNNRLQKWGATGSK